MDLEDILKIIEWKIQKKFHWEKTWHDIYHLKRVVSLANHIQKIEWWDKEIILISALLHDIHRIIANERGTYCEPKESLTIISELLQDIKIKESKKNHILHCIEFHEEFNFWNWKKTVNDIETLILQDADNLDSMWAIWIARTFAFWWAINRSIFDPEHKLDNDIEFNNYKKDISSYHFLYNYNLNLKNNMNTKTAKTMAKERHQFLDHFLNEFMSEWKGEK